MELFEKELASLRRIQAALIAPLAKEKEQSTMIFYCGTIRLRNGMMYRIADVVLERKMLFGKYQALRDDGSAVPQSEEFSGNGAWNLLPSFVGDPFSVVELDLEPQHEGNRPNL